jgi:hypothetical protein
METERPYEHDDDEELSDPDPEELDEVESAEIRDPVPSPHLHPF